MRPAQDRVKSQLVNANWQTKPGFIRWVQEQFFSLDWLEMEHSYQAKAQGWARWHYRLLGTKAHKTQEWGVKILKGENAK
jgi:hypothetical protein